MIASPAQFSTVEQILIGGVVAANVLLAMHAWRSAERSSERFGVGALAVIGTTALGLIVMHLAGG